jgi:CHAD domain-containing protein
MALPPDLLHRPVDEACRVVALQFLDEAIAARPRIGVDDEGLHDFRVALRRLRSTLRAYRAHLGRPLRRRDRDRLRRLVDATGISRDAEVELLWLREQTLAPEEQAGAAWRAAQLEAAKALGDAELAERAQHFARLADRVRRGLARYAVDLSAVPPPLGLALGPLVAEHGDALEEGLRAIGGPDDEETAHAARIEAKRLRYLVEPWKPLDPVGDVVGELKELQDVLGDLHDAHVAAAAMAGTQEGAPPEAQAGLRALERRQRERAARLWSELEREWLRGERTAAMIAHARGLSAVFAQ